MIKSLTVINVCLIMASQWRYFWKFM